MTTPYTPPPTLGVSKTNQVAQLTATLAKRKQANDAVAQAAAALAAQRTASAPGPTTGSSTTGGTDHAS